MTEIKCKEIVLLSVDLLQEFQDNANEHSPEHTKELASWIEFYGFRESLIIDRQPNENGKHDIVCGNGRFQACKLLGMTNIPCVMQDFKSYDEKYAFHVAHNASAKDEWSRLNLSKINTKLQEIGPMPIEMLAIKDFKVDIAEILDHQCDEDECPELKKESITKRGDVWILGNHRLLCGDSTMIDDVEKLMCGGKAEILFSSPPYSDMRDYGNHGKEKNVSIISDFITSFYGKYNYLVFNLGIKRENHSIVEYWNEYLDKAKSTGMKFLTWNVWDKMVSGGVSNQNAMFAIEHEWIFVFGNKEKKLNRTMEKSEDSKKRLRSAKKDKNGNPLRLVRQQNGSTKFSSCGQEYEFKNMPTVTQILPQLARGEHTLKHPAVFPVLLPESYIEAMTNENQSVIDCFCGSGSTLIACEKTNRKCYGMEIDEKYCDVIISRYMKFTGRDDVFLESTGEKYNVLSNLRKEKEG